MPVLCGPALAGADGSMNPSESLRDVIGRGVELTACEAVAVAQQLIASADVDRHRPLSLDQVRLGADGSIAWGQCLGAPRVSEIGMLLAEMLPHEGTTRVSGALRYTIARALSEVEAPPFDSLSDLSAALARHEQRDPVAVVRELYARAASKPTKRAESPVDRRRRTPSTTTLRRQLHEADEALFSHLHRTVTVAAAPQPSLPPAAAVDPLILIPESAYVAAGDGFDAARWAIGATVALLVSFGAGYAVVAGVGATKVASPAAQGTASAATPVDDASRRPPMPDGMPALGTARQSDDRPASRSHQSPSQ